MRYMRAKEDPKNEAEKQGRDENYKERREEEGRNIDGRERGKERR